MKKFEGVDIRECFDFRLSTAEVVIMRDGTWKVYIYNKVSPDLKEGDDPIGPIETYDTKIPVVEGDTFCKENLIACYEWIYSIRDKYSIPDIEEFKPYVARINQANKALADLLQAKIDLENSQGGK